MFKRLLLFSIGLAGLFLLSSCSHHRPQSATSISGIINHYAAVTDIDRCAGVTVEDASRFSTGDLVMIIQMQGATINGSNTSAYGTITDYGSAGTYELARIHWIAGNTIHFQKRIINTYDVAGNVQLVYVPEYKNVSVDGMLTCKQWDGKVGGVLALQASGAVIFNADVNVDGKGFRGGEVHEQTAVLPNFEGGFVGTDLQKYSQKGEGIAGFGIGNQTLGRGAPANGGGGGGNHNGGGGGGSNGGCGGKGGFSYQHPRYSGDYQIAQGLGGHTLDQEYSRLFLGGGGGAGHTNNSTSSDGGNGGGIVFLQATRIIGNNHSIQSRGASTLTSKYDGASGAGAGGTVALDIRATCEGLNVDVAGGNGGNSDNDVEHKDVGPGGGGGGGVVWFTLAALPPGQINVNVQGGQNGITIRNTPYGATPGCDGVIQFGLIVPKGTETCDENEEVRTPTYENPKLTSTSSGPDVRTLSAR